MSFFDPTMINDPLPKKWEDYDLHVEVSELDYQIIQYLEKTGWEYFSNSGGLLGNQEGIRDNKTRWYGLRKDNIE